jgi:hypothetical protein
MSTDWIAPEACTLPTPQRPVRGAEFDSLFAEHLVRADRLEPTRARMVFGLRSDGAGTANLTELTERVRDLTERESACCSFFTFTLTPAQDPDTLLLAIEVPPGHSDVLAALVDRAVASRGTA